MFQTLKASEPGAGSTHDAFVRAVSEWRAGVGAASIPAEIINHTAYRRIVDLGPAVVPYILREIETKSSLLVVGTGKRQPGCALNITQIFFRAEQRQIHSHHERLAGFGGNGVA